jgi:hypothetical protein
MWVSGVEPIDNVGKTRSLGAGSLVSCYDPSFHRNSVDVTEASNGPKAEGRARFFPLDATRSPLAALGLIAGFGPLGKITRPLLTPQVVAYTIIW